MSARRGEETSMPVTRSGPTPVFGDYLTKFALIPKGGTALPPNSPLLTGFLNLQWVDVPAFQRGISWERDKVEELLSSASILLGNVIFGSFTLQPGTRLAAPFPPQYAPPTYLQLVDGLQRFAAGTALLAILDQLVLDPNGGFVQYRTPYAPLQNRLYGQRDVYLFNDQLLQTYSRRAVASGYSRLRSEIEALVLSKLNPNDNAAFASEIVELFLSRQIAIDEYFNFATSVELMATFLGINTVRVELSQVDLLRAHIVEKAESSGWLDTDIEAMENDFVDVFMKKGEKPRTEFLPFVGIILRSIEDNSGALFVPSWNASLLIQEVYTFLRFVEDVASCTDAFVNEIRNCGAIPFACLLGHYYRSLLTTGTAPSFLNNPPGNTECAELHEFLCAVYRAVIAGKVGKTGDVAGKLFGGTIPSLSSAAASVASTFSGAPLSVALSVSWIRSNLEVADRNRAKRIFNAMLLGPAPHSGGTWGTPYAPLVFGRKAVNYNVDHLLPLAMRQATLPGGREIDTMRNFAPLPANNNRVAKATSCSLKLGAGGIYATLVGGGSPHPYLGWLVANQGGLGPTLDNQKHLEPNVNPPIGDDRLQEIASVLEKRI